MMRETRRRRATEQTRQTDLPTGGCEQVGAADDLGDALLDIVGDHRKLIRPIAEPIANQQVSALRGRVLRLRATQAILESFDPWLHDRTPAEAVAEAQPPVAARTRVGTLTVGARRDLLQARPRAIAAVHQTLIHEASERGSIDLPAIALSHWRTVGLESEPGEVLEQGFLEIAPAPLPIVVLDAQAHDATDLPGQGPDIQRVDDVAKMQESRGRGSESGDEGWSGATGHRKPV